MIRLATVWAATLLIALTLGCQQASDDARLMQDSAAASEVSRIRKVLSASEPFSPEDFASVEQLRARFPNAKLINDTYQSALYQRADWETLERHLLSKSAAPPALDDAKMLALSYFRQGKYAELVEHSKTARAAYPEDYELLKLHAVACFESGRESEAANLLDQHWSQIMAKQDVDAIVLRGRVHQRLKQDAAAMEKLQLALQISPENKGALNALARIYFAQGNRARAAELSAQAEAVQARATRRSTQQLRLVSQLGSMQERWQSEDYPAVIALARQSLAQVDQETKLVLLQYIINSHQRLGQVDAALAAQRELEGVRR